MLCVTHKADNSVTEQKRLIPYLLLLHSNTPSTYYHNFKINIYNFFFNYQLQFILTFKLNICF